MVHALAISAAWVCLATAQSPGSGYTIQGNECTLPRCQVTAWEEVKVPAQEAGVLVTLEAREGLYVTAGQELARIDDAQARLEAKQAMYDQTVAKKQAENDINVRFAHKSCEVAKSEWTQAQMANREVKGSITATEMRRLLLASEKAELQIEQAERDMEVAVATMEAKGVALELANMKIERRTIRSPLSGLIVELFHHKGEWVNPGDPLLRILRMDRLRVQGFLNVRDFGPEVAGALVTVQVAMPGGRIESFPGKIVYVSPEVEPVTGDFRVWAEVENRKLTLRPGVSATMVIHLRGG